MVWSATRRLTLAAGALLAAGLLAATPARAAGLTWFQPTVPQAGEPVTGQLVYEPDPGNFINDGIVDLTLPDGLGIVWNFPNSYITPLGGSTYEVNSHNTMALPWAPLVTFTTTAPGSFEVLWDAEIHQEPEVYQGDVIYREVVFAQGAFNVEVAPSPCRRRWA